MLGLALDGVVIIGLVMLLNQDDEQPGFLGAILAALGISAFAFAGMVLLAGTGWLGLTAVLVAAAVLTSLIFVFFFGVQPGRAAIGGVIFLVYKMAISLLWTSMLR